MLAHAVSPQRAQARLGEEMFINGYALKTWEWLLTHVLDLLGRASQLGFYKVFTSGFALRAAHAVFLH